MSLTRFNGYSWFANQAWHVNVRVEEVVGRAIPDQEAFPVLTMTNDVSLPTDANWEGRSASFTSTAHGESWNIVVQCIDRWPRHQVRTNLYADLGASPIIPHIWRSCCVASGEGVTRVSGNGLHRSDSCGKRTLHLWSSGRLKRDRSKTKVQHSQYEWQGIIHKRQKLGKCRLPVVVVKMEWSLTSVASLHSACVHLFDLRTDLACREAFDAFYLIFFRPPVDLTQLRLSCTEMRMKENSLPPPGTTASTTSTVPLRTYENIDPTPPPMVPLRPPPVILPTSASARKM